MFKGIRDYLKNVLIVGIAGLYLLGFLNAPTLFAQNEISCSQLELIQISLIIQNSDFLTEYGKVTDLISQNDDLKNHLTEVILKVDQLQQKWWEDTVPKFPNCVEGSTVRVNMGRVLDELLIASTMGQLALLEIKEGNVINASQYLASAEYHIDMWTDLQTDTVDLLQEIMESFSE